MRRVYHVLTSLPAAMVTVLVGLSPAAASPPEIGQVIFAKGAATAQLEGQPPRFIGTGLPLFEGDVISTGEQSFAVFSLDDGSKMTLRPNTVFQIEGFSQEANQESALMRLFKGGLRAVTGLVAKRNPERYQISTVVATIGIRGTKFDVRLCDEACAGAAKTFTAEPKLAYSPVVARATIVSGTLTATAASGASRTVARGGPVYEKERLETATKSFAVLAFRDETTVTLRSATVFEVDEYSPEPYETAEERVFFKLLKGGLRVLTGAVAKRNPDAFKVSTVVATIGIRGSGFDLHCGGACEATELTADPFSAATPSAECSPGSSPAGVAADDGLVASAWADAINVELSDCIFPLSAGETALVEPGSRQPRPLAETPGFMRDDAPRPDEVDVDFEDLFAAEPAPEKPGLFLVIRDGHVALLTADDVLHLGAGESGFVDSLTGEVVRLDQTPAFMQQERVPAPEDFDPASQGMLDFFGDDFDSPSGQEPLACTIQ